MSGSLTRIGKFFERLDSLAEFERDMDRATVPPDSLDFIEIQHAAEGIFDSADDYVHARDVFGEFRASQEGATSGDQVLQAAARFGNMSDPFIDRLYMKLADTKRNALANLFGDDLPNVRQAIKNSDEVVLVRRNENTAYNDASGQAFREAEYIPDATELAQRIVWDLIQIIEIL